jgi:hypothetical protein
VINKESDGDDKDQAIDKLNREFSEKLILDSGNMVEFGVSDDFEE